MCACKPCILYMRVYYIEQIKQQNGIVSHLWLVFVLWIVCIRRLKTCSSFSFCFSLHFLSLCRKFYQFFHNTMWQIPWQRKFRINCRVKRHIEYLHRERRIKKKKTQIQNRIIRKYPRNTMYKLIISTLNRSTFRCHRNGWINPILNWVKHVYEFHQNLCVQPECANLAHDRWEFNSLPLELFRTQFEETLICNCCIERKNRNRNETNSANFPSC